MSGTFGHSFCLVGSCGQLFLERHSGGLCFGVRKSGTGSHLLYLLTDHHLLQVQSTPIITLLCIEAQETHSKGIGVSNNQKLKYNQQTWERLEEAILKCEQYTLRKLIFFVK